MTANSVPDSAPDSGETVLEVRDVAVHFALGGGWFGGPRRMLRAVDGIDLELRRGECLSIVGESGCGKTTLALAILGLQKPTRGEVVFNGLSSGLGADSHASRMERARIAQMVFQDPYASLNPRQTVRATLETPLRLHGITDKAEIEARLAKILADVGLRRDQADRYPHEFSGGQRQRIGIARALILEPRIVVLDEPVSALDVSIRAQIINLLLDLKDRLGLSYIMISHDLGVVEHMSDRVAVMYLGRIVETGGWRSIFTAPRHPYTRALIAAIPDPLKRGTAVRMAGEAPNPIDAPEGCAFHPRCPERRDICVRPPVPPLEDLGAGHRVRCRRARELAVR